jgi:hypothetical protein
MMTLRVATMCATLLFLPSLALAQTSAVGTGTANSSSQSQAIAVGGGGGSATASGGRASSQIIFNTPAQTNSNNNSRVRQSGSLRTTPNAIAPGLAAAGIESCQGSISAAGSVTGFGLSFGGPIMDRECNLRLWARTLYAMGQRELVGGVLAQSDVVNKAMQIVDQNRQPNGQVVYNAPARAGVVAVGAPGTRSRAGMYSSCQRWSGGAVGVGTCVY